MVTKVTLAKDITAECPERVEERIMEHEDTILYLYGSRGSACGTLSNNNQVPSKQNCIVLCAKGSKWPQKTLPSKNRCLT